VSLLAELVCAGGREKERELIYSFRCFSLDMYTTIKMTQSYRTVYIIYNFFLGRYMCMSD